MFDIGFFELVVIAVVALLVIGPEQLPSTLRTLGLWWGRFKRALQSTRMEIEQQIGADDIRRQLHNEEVMQRLQANKEAIERTVSENVEAINESLEDNINAPAKETMKKIDESISTTEKPANTAKTKS